MKKQQINLRECREVLDALEHFGYGPYICRANWRLKDLRAILHKYQERMSKNLTIEEFINVFDGADMRYKNVIHTLYYNVLLVELVDKRTGKSIVKYSRKVYKDTKDYKYIKNLLRDNSNFVVMSAYFEGDNND